MRKFAREKIGEIKDFTGISSKCEVWVGKYDMVIDTENLTVDESVKVIFNHIYMLQMKFFKDKINNLKYPFI